MKCVRLFVAGLAFVGWALAQGELPKCAATCLQTATIDETDPLRICDDGPLSAAFQNCVAGACTIKEILVAANVSSTLCSRPIRDRSNIQFTICIIAGSVALAFVSVRLLVVLMQSSIGMDDIFCIAAEATCLSTTVMQAITPRLGFGKDTWAVPADRIYLILKLIYASQISYFLSSGFTKLSLLFFFRRFFPSRMTQRAINVCIGVAAVYTLSFSLTILFACKPISAVWTAWDDESGKPDYCINQHRFYLVAAGFNIAIDIAIALIPIPGLASLRLSVWKKFLLLSIFCVGAITIVVSCIRLSAVAVYATSTNPMYDNMMAGVYSILELNVGIICVCMPSFRRLFTQTIPRCRRSSSKRSTLNGIPTEGTIERTVSIGIEAASGDVKDEDEEQLMELEENGVNSVSSFHSSPLDRGIIP